MQDNFSVLHTQSTNSSCKSFSLFFLSLSLHHSSSFSISALLLLLSFLEGGGWGGAQGCNMIEFACVLQLDMFHKLFVNVKLISFTN